MNEIRKETAASQSFGRGSDNYRSAAKYGVWRDGKKIGMLMADDVRYMQKRQWEVLRFDEAGVIRPYRRFDSFNLAKAFASTWDGNR
jgi:hypothetical protein